MRRKRKYMEFNEKSKLKKVMLYINKNFRKMTLKEKKELAKKPFPKFLKINN